MNRVLLAVLLAGFSAQAIKLTHYWFRQKTLTWHDLVVTGGMPSSHSAFVTSLATSIYLQEGASTAFAVSLVLAFIVLRDAFGVRRTVGEEGRLISEILKRLKLNTDTHIALGHTPLQVLVGALMGGVVAGGVYFL